MNYDNKHTDKKLQELENQSIPDLSKMDEHWQQMNSLLQPRIPAKKDMARKKLWFALAGVVSLLIISLFIFRGQQSAGERKISDTAVDTLPFKITVSADPSRSKTDTAIFLKARTSGGRDTIFKAVPVNKQAPKNNTALLEKFYEQVQKEPQHFQVDNLRDTIIYGKEGTRLYIPANSFEAKESVTVLLTEFYSIDDMIMNKLTTTSGGQRLVTGGMIYLDARDKDQYVVDLKKGASLRLDMPKLDNQPPMELFYGYDYYRSDATTIMDSINWNRTNQVFTDAKENPVKSLLINKSNPVNTKRDTLRLMERGDLPITFNYVARDTVSGKPDFTIKGDSILRQKFGVDIKQLGWINCDRFNNDPRPKVELIVDLGDNPDNYNTMLVFDKPASILPRSSRQGNFIRFSNLPEGEAARIVAVGIKNGKPVTAMKKLVVTRATVNDLKFEEISASSARTKLGK